MLICLVCSNVGLHATLLELGRQTQQCKQQCETTIRLISKEARASVIGHFQGHTKTVLQMLLLLFYS